jgi:DNA-binding MarR family transcriptional regulator
MDRAIGFELRNLTILIKRDIHKNSDISLDNGTELHGQVVEFLFRNQNREIYQKDFEEEFMIRRSTASRMLTLMEKNDMIQRLSVGNDARLKRIVLTDKAINIHSKMKILGAKMDKKIKNGISEEDLNVFFKVIDQIKKNLED